ncbi:hypothetical protein FGB62_48g054 [Gracilaria domingensis]|nr:hypothetical protein FGB62_48g054 [Gracilaria domingensis]
MFRAAPDPTCGCGAGSASQAPANQTPRHGARRARCPARAAGAAGTAGAAGAVGPRAHFRTARAPRAGAGDSTFEFECSRQEPPSAATRAATRARARRRRARTAPPMRAPRAARAGPTAPPLGAVVSAAAADNAPRAAERCAQRLLTAHAPSVPSAMAAFQPPAAARHPRAFCMHIASCSSAFKLRPATAVRPILRLSPLRPSPAAISKIALVSALLLH